ncbi:MAG: hypothetical protein BWY67_02259 [Bacteroidetes bacterium ADurb.Bin397]|nr:MAG: hypothetical protein BWY67_02259 [Bacteroidetes bacterium ADurb.Bin397]
MYDTVMISADALADADFNKVGSVEGSGTDEVIYKIPVAGYTGTVSVKAKLYYQAVPPKWLDEMFTLNSAAIDTFRNMYMAADKDPILVAADSLTDVLSGINQFNPANDDLQVWPTITSGREINFTINTKNPVVSVSLYSSNGKKISQMNNRFLKGNHKYTLPDVAGTYLLKITTSEKSYYKKIVKY